MEFAMVPFAIESYDEVLALWRQSEGVGLSDADSKQNVRTYGVTDPMKMAPYVQIQGRARFTTEEAERHGLWNEMLAPIFSGPDDPNYGVVVVTPYRIEYCTPGKYEPEVWERS